MSERNTTRPGVIGVFRSAAHLLLLEGDQLLLLLRANTGYEDGKYSVVAGHIDIGESVRQAMVREASEEANIELNVRDLEVVHVMQRLKVDGEMTIDFFLRPCRWGGTIQNREPEKCSHLGWFSVKDLPSNIVPYVRHAILEVNKGATYSEFGWEDEGSKIAAGKG
jgi:8-oxo-dGTP diphosphatase